MIKLVGAWGEEVNSKATQSSQESDKKVTDNYVEDRLVACVNSEAL